VQLDFIRLYFQEVLRKQSVKHIFFDSLEPCVRQVACLAGPYNT